MCELSARVPRLRLWAATLSHTDIPPGLQVEPLTLPLRCAPVVLREVQPTVDRLSAGIHSYTTDTPSPSDGPDVIRLRHEGAGHAGRWPVECDGCGREVARVLRQLNVGVTGTSGSGDIDTVPLQTVGERP